MNEAMRDWVANVDDTYYLIGTVAGPHPYPTMVRDFQRVIGMEARRRCWKRGAPAGRRGRLHRRRLERHGPVPSVPRRRRGPPDRRRGGGHGVDTGSTRPPDAAARPACCTATAPTCCRTTTARSAKRTSISAGLDYPGVGPEHACLQDIGRVEYVPITDDEALDAFQLLSRTEGIIPALEPAHALAYVTKLAPTMARTRSS